LKGLSKTEIGGFGVVIMDELRDKHPEKFNESGGMDWKWFESEIRPANFIYIRNDKNSLSFTLQKGAVEDVGVNGCDVSALIHSAKLIIGGSSPCREYSLAVTKLEEALHWLGAK